MSKCCIINDDSWVVSLLLDTTGSSHYWENDCSTQREGPTQILLQQKSRMPLAGLVYLIEKLQYNLNQIPYNLNSLLIARIVDPFNTQNSFTIHCPYNAHRVPIFR